MIRRILTYAMLILGAVLFGYPFLWMIAVPSNRRWQSAPSASCRAG